ncbi:hypothetical protein BCV69DRAFT_299401 [Microstroma glucosiphilum]|uniref:Cyclin-D1-binding protein 1-like N-terminal domain-containing protein n=1 Tax=Pseudomicrostroma glucosiphilum TaxID=1684307 RepID=A0A316U4Y2_9BASI|nr:hypothetical protein BCV69DRAFT_299401 [Pseudomicrostroma glucosiphilum]PWN20260.1 hypothetical protein BCV69DRAFT_299401 [Pseudomicrostroma glucosiphilum]
MSAEEKGLLRLVILCSTGLASLVPSGSSPTEAHVTFPSSSKSLPTRPQFAALRKQIRQDAVQILTQAGKCATNLGVALKPSKSRAQSSAIASSIVENLDAASIAAAQKQIDDWTTDLVPKLIFLVNKSWKEAQVYIEEEQPKAPGAAEMSAEEKEDRDRMEEMAKQMGGMVMTGAELRGQTKAYTKPANLGLGLTWAKVFKSHVGEVLQAIASLAEACMDQRTKGAVKAASEARDRREGLPLRSGATSASLVAKTVQDIRKECLEKTAAVLEACDTAVKNLPQTNLEAIKARWTERGELLEDGIEELNSAASPAEGGNERDQDDLDSDFSAGKTALAKRLAPLLKMGRLSHERILETYLTAANDVKDSVDLSSLDDLSELLARQQDDLVAAVIWGDFDQLQESEEDDDEEEQEELGESAETSPAAKAKKICQEYCEVVQNLSQAVSDDEKIRVIAEEMQKLAEGISDAEWEAAVEEDEE